MIEVKAPDEFIAELWTYADEVPTLGSMASSTIAGRPSRSF